MNSADGLKIKTLFQDSLDYVEPEEGYEVEASGAASPVAVIFDGDVRHRVGIGFRKTLTR